MKFLDQKEIVKMVPAKRLRQSIAFLQSKHTHLQNYDSLEDSIEALISEAPKNISASGLEFHLAVVRNEILRELRKRGTFTGQSIVEELTFYIFRDGSHPRPFHRAFEWIRDAGLHRPGLLVFALHGVGILGFGAFRALGRGNTTVEFVLKQAGRVFSPQTNSDRRTAELIERARKYLGIKQKVPRDSIEHHLRFPVMAWMTRNPLLFVRWRAVSGERFETISDHEAAAVDLLPNLHPHT